MGGERPDAFLAALPHRLEAAVGVTELEAATRPPAASAVVRDIEPDAIRVGGRLRASTLPRVRLVPARAVDAPALARAWGIERPVAVSVDVHQARWQLEAAGPGVPDPHGPRIATSAVTAGRWSLRIRLAGRPAGPMPTLVAGASPAYDVAERGGEVTSIEVSVTPWPADVVTPSHPDAVTLLAAMAAAWPAARGGWAVDQGAAFVVVRDVTGAAAGATLEIAADGVADARRLCLAAARDAGPSGSALLDVLEALSHDAGARGLRLDGSTFLHGGAIPWARHGYAVAPPYDGDADGPVWAERDLREPAW